MLTPYQFAANSPIRMIDLDGLEAWDSMAESSGGESAANFANAVTNTGLRLFPDLERHLRYKQFAKIGITDSKTVEQFVLRIRLVAVGDPYFDLRGNVIQNHERAFVLEPKVSMGEEALQTVLDGLMVASVFQGSGSGTTPGVLLGKGNKVITVSALHHIFTNKNFIRGQQWSKKFEPLFEKAGYTLDDAINKIRVLGHKGPHPDEYHEAVFNRLKESTEGLEGQSYKDAFDKTLDALGKEASTEGTNLNKLLTKTD